MLLRTGRLAAAAAAILLFLVPSELPAAEPEEPKPELTEKISFPSPNGKYALRVMYDAALNEQMTANNEPENDGIFSNAMHELAIVSLPDKEILHDLTKSVFEHGNNFSGLALLWSSDSKWCAFSLAFPRLGYTSVYHLVGTNFKLAHKPNDLEVPAKRAVRMEYIKPVRWVKPGVLELSIERIYRGDEPSDDITGFTASFEGKGKWKVLKKTR